MARLALASGIAVALLAGACRTGQPPSRGNAAPAGDPDTVAVYALVLREVVKRPGADRYVIDPQWSGEVRGRMPRDIPADLPVEWFGDADAKPQDADVLFAWSRFRERYGPDLGWTSFSRVRFSRDGRSASVDVWHGFDGLSARGWRVFLDKDAGVWRIHRKEVGPVA